MKFASRVEVMTFYLKYRPRKIEELDLNSVRESLGGILKSGKMAHAYVFLGPRGAGKTSAARILAKVINCQANKVLGEPCLSCGVCQAIESGSAVDVIEIDGASNRGIDNIRELREKIGLAPVQATKKVYIIDEVHMLSVEAFNALLKTLEEPPEHAVFILCTTEEHKVPATVMSRCVRVQFSKASVEEMKRSLLKAVEGEKLAVEDEALTYLAGAVDGSFREGHKLLEQLTTLEKIDLAGVKQVLGDRGVGVEKLAEALLLGQTKQVLVMIEEGEQVGVSWESWGRNLLGELRREFKASLGLGIPKVAVGEARAKQVLLATAAAVGQMKWAVLPQIPLEILAVEVGLGVEKSEFINEVKKKPEKVVSGEDRGKEQVNEQVKEQEEEIVEESSQEASGEILAASFEEVSNGWGQIVDELKPMNHSVAGLLRSARPKAVEQGTLILEVFYKFHKDQLEQEAKRRILEEVIRRKVGLSKVRCVLGEKAQAAILQMAEHNNIEVVAEDQKLAEIVEEVFL